MINVHKFLFAYLASVPLMFYFQAFKILLQNVQWYLSGHHQVLSLQSSIGFSDRRFV